MTFDELNGLMNQPCTGCGAESGSKGQRNGIYTDEVSGAVRGVLCRPCASAVGYAGHDVDTLRRLAAMLASD